LGENARFYNIVRPCADPYAEPKSAGKFRIVESGNGLTTELLVERILERRLDFVERNKQVRML
jgi:ethanolamine-phosphate cytidylyltransferase